jgi:hypothetical protein
MRSEITHALGQTINEHIADVGEWSQRAEEGERRDIGGSSAETPGVDFTNGAMQGRLDPFTRLPLIRARERRCGNIKINFS